MKACSIEGCPRDHYAKQLCHMHYERKRTGSLNVSAEPAIRWVSSIDEAFALYAKPGDPAACWEWSGARMDSGYGRFGNRLAHRLALARTGVMVGADDLVLHSCDNPPCVNPGHLRVGDHAANSQDAVVRRRWPRGSGHANAKLTDSAAAEIRISTETQRALARRFGVSQQAISQVRTGKTFAGTSTANDTKEI